MSKEEILAKLVAIAEGDEPPTFGEGDFSIVNLQRGVGGAFVLELHTDDGIYHHSADTLDELYDMIRVFYRLRNPCRIQRRLLTSLRDALDSAGD